MRVDVYRNLNKDCLSIKSREPDNYGKVVDHVDEILVSDVEFVVRDNGRERAVESGVRNVHAFVRGNTISREKRLNDGISVTYNPFEYEQFVTVEDKKPVESAELVSVTTDDVVASVVS